MRPLNLGLALSFALVITITACKPDDGDPNSTPASCTYEGATHASATNFAAADGCNTCSCYDGAVACTEKACGPCAGGGAEVCVQDGELACERWACVECSGDRDCDADSWCRQTQEGGSECVAFAGPGETCGGYVLPWTRGRCDEDLSCVHPEATGDIPGKCGTCGYEGTAYQLGETFPASDGCNTCTCGEDGLIACTKIFCPAPACHYLEQDYSGGDSFDSYDACNTCFCSEDGVVGCTRIGCPDSCRDGSQPVSCLVNPCDVSRCDVDGATCIADYCGGCHARWFDGKGNTVCE
jgi:hypothetical protein